jgi:hypothetical protein
MMNLGLLNSYLRKFIGNGNGMHIQDVVTVPKAGYLSIEVTDHVAGRKYWHIDESKNTITDIYRRNAVRMLGNDNIAGRIVTKMKFGDQGHDTGNPSVPTPTTASMTSLNNMFLSKVITLKTFYDDVVNNMTMVTFEVELTTAEGNGSGGTQIYSEAGLFTDNESYTDSVSGLPTSGMVAVKHFGVLTKTSALSFKFQWRIIL